MANPVSLWRKFLALPNDNLTKTLIFAFLLALTASVIVSVAAVTLRPFQQANLERERQARMAEIVSALPQISGLLDETGVDALEVRIVNLSTGEFAVRLMGLSPPQSSLRPPDSTLPAIPSAARNCRPRPISRG